MNKILLKLAIAYIMLNIIRVLGTQSITYLFLIWNAFLAFIPYFLSTLIRGKSGLVKVVLVMIWLLFLPNAPYILTDFIHLRYSIRSEPLLLFDFVLITSYSLFGLVCYYASLRNIFDSFPENIINKYSNGAFLLIHFLIGIGIFLGRVQRWNSWDIFYHPTAIFENTFNLLISGSPIFYFLTLGFMLFLGFLQLLFLKIK